MYMHVFMFPWSFPSFFCWQDLDVRQTDISFIDVKYVFKFFMYFFAYGQGLNRGHNNIIEPKKPAPGHFLLLKWRKCSGGAKKVLVEHPGLLPEQICSPPKDLFFLYCAAISFVPALYQHRHPHCLQYRFRRLFTCTPPQWHPLTRVHPAPVGVIPHGRHPDAVDKVECKEGIPPYTYTSLVVPHVAVGKLLHGQVGGNDGLVLKTSVQLDGMIGPPAALARPSPAGGGGSMRHRRQCTPCSTQWRLLFIQGGGGQRKIKRRIFRGVSTDDMQGGKRTPPSQKNGEMPSALSHDAYPPPLSLPCLTFDGAGGTHRPAGAAVGLIHGVVHNAQAVKIVPRGPVAVPILAAPIARPIPLPPPARWWRFSMAAAVNEGKASGTRLHITE